MWKNRAVRFGVAQFFCGLRSFSAAAAQTQQSEFFKTFLLRFAEKPCYIRSQFAICCIDEIANSPQKFK